VAGSEWQTLGDTAFALARDGITIQRKLDAAAAAQDERFAAMLAAVPEPARPLLLPLLPAHLRLKEHHVECSLRVTTARSIEFSLVARPINLGFAALYGTTAAESCTLSVAVSAVARGATS
jgi:hypothetical protein